jgi:hypothetical protein
MRRALLTELPLLSRFYGLSPADIDQMNFREIDEYRSILRQIEAKGGDPWQVVVAGS